ncbi:hypothetical protein B0J17DRAFT_266431 [Rhizoctonia solani]|nr:hypothetical protein B0J17DRAFT_266431 [Rhizoctonia solani]
MSGKMPEFIPPPPPKPVSPPNSAQVITEILRVMDATQPDDAINALYLIPSLPALIVQGGKGGHPPPPPPHSPPPPRPKTSTLGDTRHEDAPEGYPPPPPPSSPPPKSRSVQCMTVVPTSFASFIAESIHSYVYWMRIYPTKGVPPSNNFPTPPRPHPDPIPPPPPPPRVELNMALGMFAGIDLLYANTAKLGTNLLSPHGGVVVGCV